MCITDDLQRDPALRAAMRQRFQYPRFKVQAEMVAPPQCTSYSTVGTAVDYLIRGKVRSLNPERTHSNDVLVAEYAYASLHRYLRRQGKGLVGVGRKPAMILPAYQVLKCVTPGYSNALEQVAAYALHGMLTAEVIAAALFLARLDPFYRAGVIDPGLIEPDEQANADVRDVMAHLPTDLFVSAKRCYLNPTFGKASELVAGADADLVVDDLLIDIKTTKNLSVRRSHLDQLLCYYALHQIGGLNDEPRARPIKRVGIYFSRHGLLWSVPIEELAPRRTLNEFKGWLTNYYS